MNKVFKHIIYLFFIAISISVYSQDNAVKGYKIVGDEVVFTFDIRDYTKYTNEKTSRRIRVESFDITNVVVSGEFNSWSRDKWQMNKVDEYTYQLKKNIDDFTDEFSWEFKFIINNSYWAEPNKKVNNITPAVDDYGYNLNVFNLKMFTAHPNENGNACFKLDGYKDAKRVVLTGTFNRWDEDIFNMNKTENGWELTLQVNPGQYQYKFIIDGDWVEDMRNPDKVENEYHGFNSVINITEPFTFNLEGHLDAEKVILTGTFNDWSEEDIKMIKTSNGWTYTAELLGGKHHYKFIIDGNWTTDPDNSVKEYDYDGNINSVCIIK